MKGLKSFTTRFEVLPLPGGPTDERLTDYLGEDSTKAGLQSKAVVPGNVVVESDGPDSDQPETKASMGDSMFILTKLMHCGHVSSVVMSDPHAMSHFVTAASMIEQSMEGWRLIGQGMQSLFTCSCFTGLQPSRNTLNQLRSAARER